MKNSSSEKKYPMAMFRLSGLCGVVRIREDEMNESPLQAILDEVREGIEGYRIQDIVDRTGLSWNSIQQIRLGNNTNPRLRTLEALWRFVQDEEMEDEEVEQ